MHRYNLGNCHCRVRFLLAIPQPPGYINCVENHCASSFWSKLNTYNFRQKMNDISGQTRETRPLLPVLKFFVVSLLAAFTWWLWKPLGAYYTILTVGGYGAWFIRKQCLFWSLSCCVVVSWLWGPIMATIVFVTSLVAVSHWWARALLALWGLLAVSYLRQDSHSTILVRDKLHSMACLAIVYYILTLGTIWFIVWSRH